MLCLSMLFYFVLSLSVSEALVTPPAFTHASIGFLAGSAGAICAYPIDYVKSQLQTEEGRLKYRDGWHCAMDIVKTSPSGPLALYRGVLLNVIGVAPEKTIKLSVNTFARATLIAHFGYLSIMGEVIAGAAAGAAQVIVTNPLEVLKLKLQTSEMTIREVLGQIQGAGDLYQGVGACIARDITFSAILFPLYAHLKVMWAATLMSVAQGEGESITFWANLLAGSFAAGPAAFLATPADVVKTRLQQARKSLSEMNLVDKVINSSDKIVPPIQIVYVDQLAVKGAAAASFLDTMVLIANQEGPEVLFSGWFERVVRSVPQFGVTLAMYDLLNSLAIQHGWLLESAAI